MIVKKYFSAKTLDKNMEIKNRFSSSPKNEEMVIGEIIVMYKGRVIFRQYIPKNKCFGIKIYKPCDETG
jgi:hypothetical protein